ncbi:Lsr2 family DNA-binding protein [Amycolatopsis carbonis]|uniref:Lsr2 family DNA-binding protein n=1 Tax=Amycolatopsis carbonis TaxID=715471 RepID=UPI003DA746A1
MGTAADRERSRAIRARAIENGYAVSDRSRVSSEVVAACEAVQQGSMSRLKRAHASVVRERRSPAARKRS